ncbi:urease accessory protein UreF [Terfezia boudieri ATCC MYA-4762]|uniref:Urease accessory protein UreF n=1 Tax=Terfezia boudieri ATCC MYA-4762 TaxID=1051890 RepID=A0A3N4LQX0_9PEZI|nr:urease accessory protein UreF [Terfezia boudieri ATCC MYA-4762]
MGAGARETLNPSLHLLVLSDSALPLGSFAFSSGLESFLTHSTPQKPSTTLLRRFLSLSLSSLSTTTLPFITAAYNIPNLPTHTTTYSAISSILHLSDTFDATTTCPVLRRASTTQGKALLSVWEKSLRPPPQSMPPSLVDLPALITSYRHQSGNDNPPHLPIAWALISLSSNLTLHQTTFVFLLNHTKALLSAAVRLNLIGPYVAQRILAAPETLEVVQRAQETGLRVGVEEAGQTVPILDLYQGRHELLYSRVFNS